MTVLLALEVFASSCVEYLPVRSVTCHVTLKGNSSYENMGYAPYQIYMMYPPYRRYERWSTATKTEEIAVSHDINLAVLDFYPSSTLLRHGCSVSTSSSFVEDDDNGSIIAIRIY